MTTSAYPGIAYPGETYPGYVAQATFSPPTRDVRLDTRHRLFSRVSLPTGITVLKSPLGSYTQVQNPTPEQIDAATICYLGGRVYPVDDTEAAALTAAGYTVVYP